MRTNLLLLAVILVGGWYLFYPAAPVVPEPVPVAPALVQRTDFSGLHTFYSTLNDPAVPVGSTHGTQGPSAIGDGLTGSTSLSLGATSSVNSGVSAQPSSTSLVSRPNNAGVAADGSNLNISQRAADIARTARGE